MAIALAYVLVLQVVLIHGVAARMHAENGFNVELCLTGDSSQQDENSSQKPTTKKACPVCQLAGAVLVLPEIPAAIALTTMIAVPFVAAYTPFNLQEYKTPRLSQGPPALV